MRNNILFLLGGIILGAVPTYLYMKKKVDEANNELNEYLSYNDISNKYNDDDFDEDRDDVEVNPVDSDEEIKKKLERNYEETTNYAAMYKGSAANYEHPMDSDDEDIPDEEDDDLSEEYTEEHKKNITKPPKIISESAIGDLPQYIESQTLLYYPEDDILTTEEDEEIPDPETYIGDALTKFGFKDNDEERIFVLNYQLDVCYDVQKIEGR